MFLNALGLLILLLFYDNVRQDNVRLLVVLGQCTLEKCTPYCCLRTMYALFLSQDNVRQDTVYVGQCTLGQCTLGQFTPYCCLWTMQALMVSRTMYARTMNTFLLSQDNVCQDHARLIAVLGQSTLEQCLPYCCSGIRYVFFYDSFTTQASKH